MKAKGANFSEIIGGGGEGDKRRNGMQNVCWHHIGYIFLNSLKHEKFNYYGMGRALDICMRTRACFIGFLEFDKKLKILGNKETSNFLFVGICSFM